MGHTRYTYRIRLSTRYTGTEGHWYVKEGYSQFPPVTKGDSPYHWTQVNVWDNTPTRRTGDNAGMREMDIPMLVDKYVGGTR